MTPTERETILSAVRLIAEHGLNACTAIVSAAQRGEIEGWQIGEASAQLEDAASELGE